MSLTALKKMLKSSGLPVTYRAFPEGEAPQLPYICYNTPGSNNFAADGKVYFAKNAVQVELYTKYKDTETEKRVEEAISSVFWEKTESYIEKQHCYQIVYELEV